MSESEQYIVSIGTGTNQLPLIKAAKLLGYKIIGVGELKEGFEFYESRVEESQVHLSGRLTYPTSIEGKKLFVWREQGIGDQLMWSWLFGCLEDKKISAKISVDKRLESIMRDSFPSLDFTGKDPIDIYHEENFKDYDAEMVIHSVGKYFIDEIKSAQENYEQGQYRKAHLFAKKDKVAYWKKRINAETNKKTVGICWRSSLLGDMRDYHYITAEIIVEIFEALDCAVVNLQYDYTDEEIEVLQSGLGDRFINFSGIDLKDDQDALAALITSLDLVFSVATAVMALSGAVGQTTLCPGHVATLGKPFNIFIPTVKSDAGPKVLLENIERYQVEITKELSN